MKLEEALQKVKKYEKQGYVPDFDNTFYWCESCKGYTPHTFEQIGKALWSVCHGGCDSQIRLSGQLMIDDEHPPVCST